jgi:hypothetical protein
MPNFIAAVPKRRITWEGSIEEGGNKVENVYVSRYSRLEGDEVTYIEEEIDSKAGSRGVSS